MLCSDCGGAVTAITHEQTSTRQSQPSRVPTAVCVCVCSRACVRVVLKSILHVTTCFTTRASHTSAHHSCWSRKTTGERFFEPFDNNVCRCEDYGKSNMRGNRMNGAFRILVQKFYSLYMSSYTCTTWSQPNDGHCSAYRKRGPKSSDSLPQQSNRLVRLYNT